MWLINFRFHERTIVSSLTACHVTSQALCSVQSVVFSDLLIKFFKNEENSLNNHTLITLYIIVLRFYKYYFIPTVSISVMYYMDRYTTLPQYILYDLGLKRELVKGNCCYR